jgi:hypothetical protein
LQRKSTSSSGGNQSLFISKLKIIRTSNCASESSLLQEEKRVAEKDIM